MQDEMDDMKGYVQHILLYIPEIDKKMKRFNKFSSQISSDMENRFNRLNGESMPLVIRFCRISFGMSTRMIIWSRIIKNS